MVDHYVRIYRLIGSPGYPAADAYLRDRLGLAVRRSHRPAARWRASWSRSRPTATARCCCARIKAPTQVIHGLADPLVPVESGRDLAARIAGARIDLIEGMGHDLPVPLWPRFVDGIRAAAARA